MSQHLDCDPAILSCVFHISHVEVDVGEDAVNITHLSGQPLFLSEVLSLFQRSSHLLLSSIFQVVERLEDVLDAVAVDV